MAPGDARVNNGLGRALVLEGNSEEAIPYLKKAIQLQGDSVEAQYNLGTALIGEHRLQEAIDAWLTAVRIRPDFSEAEAGLGYAYYAAGNDSASLNHLRLAMDGDPDRVSVLILAASLLATCQDDMLRNGPEAVLLAERVNQLTDEKDISAVDTLSVAYAEDSRFDEAIEAEQHAMVLASQQGDATITARPKAHLEKYSSEQPLRDPADGGTL